MQRRTALTTLALLALATTPAAAPAATPRTNAPAPTMIRAMAAVGSSSGAIAIDLSTGRQLYAQRADVRRVPASVEKLSTTATVLVRMGGSGVLKTSIYGGGVLDDHGTYQGKLYMRGGGDPTFGSEWFTENVFGTGATISSLVKKLISETGIKQIHGSVVGDESLFDTRRGGPDSDYQFSYDLGARLTALVYNRGLTDNGSYQSSPALYAAARMTDELRRQGIKVSGLPSQGKLPADSELLTAIDSPPISTLIRMTNTPSDNFFAETLIKTLGARFGGAGTTAAGALVVSEQIARWGLHSTVADGSGLSHSNRTSPREVVALLSAMYKSPDVAAWRSSLAVAGRSGTLAGRMIATAAQDRCQGKTGTLHGVSALAGYCRSANNHLIAFAFLMNDVDISLARSAQNSMAAALARSKPSGAIAKSRVHARMPPTSQPSPRLLKQTDQTSLIEDLDAEALGLGKLGSRALARHQIVGLF